MAAQLSPVTPDVLRWAINEDGRSVPELAEALHVDVDAIDGWAKGDAQPTRGEVTRLADVLKRPRALFFMPAPPTAASLPPSFRHPPGDDRLVSSRARRWIRQARRVQQAVSWALASDEPADVPQVSADWAPSRAAPVARRWLGLSVEVQLNWSDDYEALRGWRDAIEERGVLVFMLEMGNGEIRGFSAWDLYAPLIVANSSRVNPAARIFTMAHELGHLLTRGDSACVEPVPDPWLGISVPGDGIERWCEEFAADLLMPAEVVQREVSGLDRAMADIDKVRWVARRFRVSHRAAALRLIDLGQAPRSLYAQVERAFAPPPAEAESEKEFRRPSRAVMRPREYGMRAIRTVLEALPPRDAMSVLRLTVNDIRRIADSEPGVRVP